MSKSIQIISIHTGPVSVSVKGESRSIEFESKARDGKTFGVAMVDHDEASVLLRLPKDFWKPGQSADDLQQAANDTLEAAAAAGKAEREAEKSDSEGTKFGAEGDKKENEGGDQGSDDEDGQSAAVKIAADNNFNRFKGAVTKCEDIELIKEIIAIEIAKEDPKENRLTVLNGRMTELQG